MKEQQKIKQPNSRMCFICGVQNPVGLHLHIYETEPGVVESQNQVIVPKPQGTTFYRLKSK